MNHNHRPEAMGYRRLSRDVMTREKETTLWSAAVYCSLRYRYYSLRFCIRSPKIRVFQSSKKRSWYTRKTFLTSFFPADCLAFSRGHPSFYGQSLFFLLGILSIVHCLTLRSKSWPLSTKLLLFGPVFLLALGWIGFVQLLIRIFESIAFDYGNYLDIPLTATNVSRALYPLAGAFLLTHFYLLFFLFSFVIIHFKHKQMDADS